MQCALTHASSNGKCHNGRLAELGRATARAAVAQYVYVRYPNLPGELLADAAAFLASDEVLARAGRNVGLQHALRSELELVGKKAKLGAPEAVEAVAGAFAALVGATMEARGASAAADLTLSMVAPAIEAVGMRAVASLADPCKTLRRLLVAEELEPPTYTILEETGRHTHLPTFLMGVFNGEDLLAEGASYSIAESKREAARNALFAHYGAEVDRFPDSWGDYAIEQVVEHMPPPE